MSRKKYFPDVTDAQWNDWHWQVQNRVSKVEDVASRINITPEEAEGITQTMETLKFGVTPYYFSLIDAEDKHCPIRRQSIPPKLILTILYMRMVILQSQD